MSNIPINASAATMFAQTVANADAFTMVVVAICVAGSLCVLWFFTSRSLKERSAARESRALRPVGATAAENELSPRLIAILAAAATAAVGRRVQIRRITFINRDTVSGWAEAGRTSIQMSHNLRRTI